MLYLIILVVGVALLIGAMRKGSTTMPKPTNIKSMTSNIDAGEAMKIIIKFAEENNYKIEDFDESSDVIVLSQDATLTSNGFFFPIYIKGNDNPHLTTIEVGIKSKVVQLGPIVSRTHDRCYNGIKAALYKAT